MMLGVALQARTVMRTGNNNQRIPSAICVPRASVAVHHLGKRHMGLRGFSPPEARDVDIFRSIRAK